MFCHVVYNFLNGNVHIVFNDTFVYVSYYTLNDAELLKKLATSIKYFL